MIIIFSTLRIAFRSCCISLDCLMHCTLHACTLLERETYSNDEVPYS